MVTKLHFHERYEFTASGKQVVASENRPFCVEVVKYKALTANKKYPLHTNHKAY